MNRTRSRSDRRDQPPAACPLSLAPLTALAVLAAALASPGTAGARPPRPSPPPSAASSPSPASVAPAAFHVLFTGRTWGLGSTSSTGDTILLLYEHMDAQGGSARIVASTHSLALGGRYLLSGKGGPVRAGLAVLGAKGAVTREVVAERVPAVESDRVIILQFPPNPHLDVPTLMQRRNRRVPRDPSLRRVDVRLVRLRAGGASVLMAERRGAVGALERDPLAWEAPAWVIEGEARHGDERARFIMLIKPYGGGARRVKLLTARKAALAGRVLLVSGGNEVSAFSRLSGGRSKRRPLDLQTLGRLGYDGIVPGAAELYYGLASLQAELKRHPLPLVATNLFHGAGARKGKPVFSRYRLVEVNGVRVALIGLVDSGLSAAVSAPDAVTALDIRDPVEEAVRTVAELHARPETRPDLVVALSNLDGKARAVFVREVVGVDVLIGNFRAGARHRPDIVLDLRDRWRRSRTGRGVALVTRSTFAMIGDLAVDGRREAGAWHPLRMRLRHQLVDHDLPRDEGLHRRLVADFLADAGRLDHKLMPPIEALIGGDASLARSVREDPEIARWLPKEQTERWQLWMTARLWGRLLASVLLDASDAEVVIAPRPDRLNTTVPGPILEYYAMQWLPRGERLCVYEVKGSVLRKLLAAQRRAEATTALAGADPRGRTVGGRPLVDKERYRLLTTGALAASPPFKRLLGGLHPQHRFRVEGARLAIDARGRRILMRDAVLAGLRAVRDANEGFGSAYLETMRRWLSPSPGLVRPRWSFAADGLTLSFSSGSNLPGQAWLANPGVRETRAVTPGYYGLGLRGAFALRYDTSTLDWETRLSGRLSRTVIDLSSIPGQKRVEQEGQDDLRGSTELRLKLVELSLGKRRRVGIVPYANATWDTEFTATTDALTRRPFPHQKELRLSAGLVSRPGGLLRELRLAALFKNDFSMRTGQAEGGVLAGLGLRLPLGRAHVVFNGRLRWYAPTSADTVEDLGVIVESTAKLVVPFGGGLAVSLFADLFYYAPKVRDAVDILGRAVQRQGASSLILGAGLTWDRLWKT